MARVLVVDDYEDTRVLVGILLEHVGHEVLTADNGLQAIALARAYHPDAIVMDISMPGMDGLEATRRIREQPAIGNVPVIAYTAHPSAAEREPGLFTDVCLKSGSTELLLDKLAHVLA